MFPTLVRAVNLDTITPRQIVALVETKVQGLHLKVTLEGGIDVRIKAARGDNVVVIDIDKPKDKALSPTYLQRFHEQVAEALIDQGLIATKEVIAQPTQDRRQATIEIPPNVFWKDALLKGAVLETVATELANAVRSPNYPEPTFQFNWRTGALQVRFDADRGHSDPDSSGAGVAYPTLNDAEVTLQTVDWERREVAVNRTTAVLRELGIFPVGAAPIFLGCFEDSQVRAIAMELPGASLALDAATEIMWRLKARTELVVFLKNSIHLITQHISTWRGEWIGELMGTSYPVEVSVIAADAPGIAAPVLRIATSQPEWPSTVRDRLAALGITATETEGAAGSQFDISDLSSVGARQLLMDANTAGIRLLGALTLPSASST